MFRTVFLLLFIAIFSTTSRALTLSLEDVPSRVRTHHPALKAARLTVEEARGRQLAGGRLANPTIETSFQNESRVSPRELLLGLEQSFPLTKRLSLEKQLTAQLVTAAELEVLDVERQLITEAQAEAIQVAALNQQHKLREKQIELARELSDFAQSRSEKGEISPLDAMQTRVDVERLQLDVRRLRTEVIRRNGALKPMLGVPAEEPLSITGDLPALVIPTSAAWQQRADYQLAQTEIDAANTDAALARSKRLEDISVGFYTAQEMQDQANGQRERTGFVGFRVSIPLPLWNRNQGEIAEKDARAERQRLEAEALASTITAEADAARREMQAHAELANEAHNRLLPLVKEQTKQLEEAYSAGQTDLLSLLRARDQRLQIEASTLDAIRDFHLARIRYEAATGATATLP